MLRKLGKGLLTCILIIVMGGLNIVEIGIEVVYQLVRLFRRGFIYAVMQFLKLIKPIYKGKLLLESRDDDMVILKFNYETEES